MRATLRELKRSASDIGRAAGAGAAAAVTSVMPVRTDPWTTGALARLSLPSLKRSATLLASRLEQIGLASGDEAVERAQQIVRERVRVKTESAWLRGRALGARPGTPVVDVEGETHLERAVESGRGAILWRMTFVSPIVLNAAIAQRGYRLTHLSSADHLAEADNRLSRQFIGPWLSRAEGRWLQERVVMQPGKATGYLDTLRERLEAGGLVSIVGDIDRGRHRTRVAVGELGLNIPSGAPSLAHATGAALLPCAPVRIAPMRYRLIVFPDAAPPHVENRREFRRLAIDAYIARRNELTQTFPASDGFL